nr:MAG: wsv325-like protein [Porcellio scaber clopovirus]
MFDRRKSPTNRLPNTSFLNFEFSGRGGKPVMNHHHLFDNFVSAFLFTLVVIVVTWLMIKLILLSYRKSHKKSINARIIPTAAAATTAADPFVNRIQNTSYFLLQNKNNSLPSSLRNADIIFYSTSLCEFFSKFDCRNFSKRRRKKHIAGAAAVVSAAAAAAIDDDGAGAATPDATPAPVNPLIIKTLFALPNGAVINKNFSLSQRELDVVWNQRRESKKNDDELFLPFKKESCARHPIIFIHSYGTHGNEENFRNRAQKTVCGCKSHGKLFTFPSSTTPPFFDLQIHKPGVNVLRFPLPGAKPLVEKVTDLGSNRYLLNTNGEIIFSDPCSQFKDGYFPIDDILIKYSDVNALRTKRPNLFSQFMETKKTPRRVLCKNQQVQKLL